MGYLGLNAPESEGAKTIFFFFKDLKSNTLFGSARS